MHMTLFQDVPIIFVLIASGPFSDMFSFGPFQHVGFGLSESPALFLR